MAHKLDGKWHSYVVIKGTGPNPTSVLADDDFFDAVTVNVNTNRIATGTHNGKPISGSVIPIGSSFAVSIEHELSTSHNFRYEGALVSEDSAHGIAVIVGTRSKVLKVDSQNKDRIASEEEVEADAESQNDGTWVGTKP